MWSPARRPAARERRRRRRLDGTGSGWHAQCTPGLPYLCAAGCNLEALAAVARSSPPRLRAPQQRPAMPPITGRFACNRQAQPTADTADAAAASAASKIGSGPGWPEAARACASCAARSRAGCQTPGGRSGEDEGREGVTVIGNRQ